MAGEDKVVVVYATFPDLSTAERVGHEIVKMKFAACVNLLPGMRSIYQWKGEVETAEEVVMIIKTRSSSSAKVIDEVGRLHPHETPALMIIDVAGGSDRYLQWLLAETDG